MGIAADGCREDPFFLRVTKGTDHVGGGTRCRDPYQHVVPIDGMLLQLFPSFFEVVFCRFHGISQGRFSSGDESNHVGVGHPEGGWNLGRVEYAQPSAGACPDIEEPSPSLHSLHDAGYQLLNLGDDLLHGGRYLLILLVDLGKDVVDRFFLQVVVPRGLFRYFNKTHDYIPLFISGLHVVIFNQPLDGRPGNGSDFDSFPGSHLP